MKKSESTSVEELEQLIERNPKSHTFFRLADLYRSMGDLDHAIAICNQGLSQHPADTTGHVVLGRCYFQKQDIPAALNKLTAACRLDRQNRPAIKLLAEIFTQQGETNKASDLYSILFRLDPFDDTIKKTRLQFPPTNAHDIYTVLGQTDLGNGISDSSPAFDDLAATSQNQSFSEHPSSDSISADDVGNRLDSIFGENSPAKPTTTLVAGNDIADRMDQLFNDTLSELAPPGSDPMSEMEETMQFDVSMIDAFGKDTPTQDTLPNEFNSLVSDIAGAIPDEDTPTQAHTDLNENDEFNSLISEIAQVLPGEETAKSTHSTVPSSDTLDKLEAHSFEVADTSENDLLTTSELILPFDESSDISLDSSTIDLNSIDTPDSANEIFDDFSDLKNQIGDILPELPTEADFSGEEFQLQESTPDDLIAENGLTETMEIPDALRDDGISSNNPLTGIYEITLEDTIDSPLEILHSDHATIDTIDLSKSAEIIDSANPELFSGFNNNQANSIPTIYSDELSVPENTEEFVIKESLSEDLIIDSELMETMEIPSMQVTDTNILLSSKPTQNEAEQQSPESESPQDQLDSKLFKISSNEPLENHELLETIEFSIGMLSKAKETLNEITTENKQSENMELLSAKLNNSDTLPNDIEIISNQSESVVEYEEFELLTENDLESGINEGTSTTKVNEEDSLVIDNDTWDSSFKTLSESPSDVTDIGTSKEQSFELISVDNDETLIQDSQIYEKDSEIFSLFDDSTINFELNKNTSDSIIDKSSVNNNISIRKDPFINDPTLYDQFVNNETLSLSKEKLNTIYEESIFGIDNETIETKVLDVSNNVIVSGDDVAEKLESMFNRPTNSDGNNPIDVPISDSSLVNSYDLIDKHAIEINTESHDFLIAPDAQHHNLLNEPSSESELHESSDDAIFEVSSFDTNREDIDTKEIFVESAELEDVPLSDSEQNLIKPAVYENEKISNNTFLAHENSPEEELTVEAFEGNELFIDEVLFLEDEPSIKTQAVETLPDTNESVNLQSDLSEDIFLVDPMVSTDTNNSVVDNIELVPEEKVEEAIPDVHSELLEISDSFSTLQESKRQRSSKQQNSSSEVELDDVIQSSYKIPDHVLTPTLADIYFQQGQLILAQQIFERLLERDSDNEKLQQRLFEVKAAVQKMHLDQQIGTLSKDDSEKKKSRITTKDKNTSEKPLAGIRIKKKKKPAARTPSTKRATK